MSGGKHRKKTIRFIALLACAIAAAAIFAFSGRQPLRGLTAGEIRSASVTAVPPGRSVPITELQELAARLQAVIVYGRDDSYPQYTGQTVAFAICKADGTQLEVLACSPFIVINGAGYRCKYKPCEALCAYANRLLSGKS